MILLNKIYKIIEIISKHGSLIFTLWLPTLTCKKIFDSIHFNCFTTLYDLTIRFQQKKMKGLETENNLNEPWNLIAIFFLLKKMCALFKAFLIKYFIAESYFNFFQFLNK